MISSIFHTILYKPLYNALVLLTDYMPGATVGFSVIILTLLVRTLLSPLTHQQINTQKKMKLVEGEMKNVRKEFPTDKMEQNKRMLELYKKHGINPFAGLILIVIQIPILLALYFVFTKGIPFSAVDLYSFVSLPESITLELFGVFDLSSKSYLMALLVGVSQYFQVKLSIPPAPKREEGDGFGQELARSMSTNMKYVMPVFIAVITIGFPSVVGLYWLTNNLFGIGHELLVRRKATELAVKNQPA